MPETEHGQAVPTVTQFSVFLENRLGVLRQTLGYFERIDSRLVAINILETSDSATIRMVFDNSQVAREALSDHRLRFLEADLLVVALPDASHGLIKVCSALFRAEVNILYVYPLMVNPMGRQALALRVDSIVDAARMLEGKFTLLDEVALRQGC